MSYTQSQAILGSGSSIGYAATQAGPFTPFLETIKIPQTDPKVPSVDVTNNSSPNATREKIPGFIDNGDMQITANYLKSDAANIRGMLRVRQWFQVQFSDGSKDTFYGWISGINGESPAPDQKVTSTFSITVTGLSTFTQS